MKMYTPKLSIKVLKSCSGCAMTQKLITAIGYKRNVHQIAANCSMFNSVEGIQRCSLGYANYGLEPIIPLEKCPKPKTRNQLYVCDMFQRYGKLEKSNYLARGESK